MSKKTIKQRIALVAASALTAGFLSVVSMPAANAVAATGDYNWGTAAATPPVAGTAGACSYSASTNSLTTLSIGATTLFLDTANLELEVTYSIKVAHTGGTPGYFNVSADSTDDGEAGIAVNNSKTEVTMSEDEADNNDLDMLNSIAWVASGVGTATFAVTKTVTATGATTTLDTFTLNVVAKCDNTYNAAKSAVQLTTGTIGTGATELTTATGVSDTADADKPAWNAAAFIALWLADQYGAPVDSTSSYLSATATGGATVSWAENATSSTQSTAVATSGLHNEVLVVFPNSATFAAVTTTVTIQYNGQTVGTKTINFRGDAKTIEVSSVRGAITTNTNNATGINASAFKVVTKDSAGNLLALNPSLYAASGQTTGIASITGSASVPANVGVTCSATAGTGTITLYYVRTSDGAAVVGPTTSLTCSSATINTYKVSLDKATYLPGEPGTMVITGLDSGGRPVADSAVLGTAASKFAIGGSGITFLSAPLHTDTSDGGKWTYKFYTTATEGDYVAGVTLSEATVVTTETAAFKVKGSSATVSNADVLKSIVSLIASINKQIQALQKLILARR